MYYVLCTMSSPVLFSYHVFCLDKLPASIMRVCYSNLLPVTTMQCVEDQNKQTNKQTNSAVQCSTVQYSVVQYSTVQYSTVQCCTVQYSVVQYSAVQYSSLQYSSLHYSTV